MGALAIASAAFSAISAGVTAIGQIQASKVAEAQADYDAKVAANNAILARREAEDAKRRGEIEEEERRKEGRLELGKFRAEAASRGVLVDEGSAADITADIAEQTELDALTIRANAERERLSFEQEALDFDAEAGLLEETAETEATGGLLSATGSVISGGAKVADKWYTYTQ